MSTRLESARDVVKYDEHPLRLLDPDNMAETSKMPLGVSGTMGQVNLIHQNTNQDANNRSHTENSHNTTIIKSQIIYNYYPNGKSILTPAQLSTIFPANGPNTFDPPFHVATNGEQNLMPSQEDIPPANKHLAIGKLRKIFYAHVSSSGGKCNSIFVQHISGFIATASTIPDDNTLQLSALNQAALHSVDACPKSRALLDHVANEELDMNYVHVTLRAIVRLGPSELSVVQTSESASQDQETDPLIAGDNEGPAAAAVNTKQMGDIQTPIHVQGDYNNVKVSTKGHGNDDQPGWFVRIWEVVKPILTCTKCASCCCCR